MVTVRIRCIFVRFNLFSYNRISRNRSRFWLYRSLSCFGKKYGNRNGRGVFQPFPFIFIPTCVVVHVAGVEDDGAAVSVGDVVHAFHHGDNMVDDRRSVGLIWLNTAYVKLEVSLEMSKPVRPPGKPVARHDFGRAEVRAPASPSLGRRQT